MNDQYGLKAIQEANLGILKFIDKTCNELNLKYYLAFGTLLGAIRHHGFIPWDDDADVWMTRKDFTTLYNHLLNDDKNNRYRMCLDQPTLLPMRLQVKVYDTAYIVKRILRAHKEIVQTHPWVDIFVLDNAPKGLKKIFYYYQIRSLTSLFLRLGGRNIANIHALIYKSVSKYSNIISKEDDFFFTYAICYLNEIHKVLYPCSYFESINRIIFEDTSFCVPFGYHLILKCLYGDYLTPPPSHLREPKHHVELMKS